MKHLLFSILLLPALLFGSETPDLRPLRVLFIGNSYTASQNLPEIVAQMAHSKGKRLYYEMHAPGGRTFERHWNEGIAQEKIASQRWDYVVFQNQSFEPVHDPANMMHYGQQLAALVEASGGRCVYFMTWAYAKERDFMKENPAYHGLFEDMQSRLDSGYKALSDEVGGQLCPIGPAWEAFRARYPDLPLHNPDASHPSPAGAYLSALMLYRVLFDEPVSAMPDVVYPYFDDKKLDRWGDRLTIHPDIRQAMEQVVNEVAAQYANRAEAPTHPAP